MCCPSTYTCPPACPSAYCLSIDPPLTSRPTNHTNHTIHTNTTRYSEGLSGRPSIIVANKTDLPAAAGNVERLQAEAEALAEEGVVGIVASSFATGDGVRDIVMDLRRRLHAQVSADWA